MSDEVVKALESLFDEGVNFADFDEGKNRPAPDGYGNGDIDEVRRRAVDRALAPVLDLVERVHAIVDPPIDGVQDDIVEVIRPFLREHGRVT